MQNLLENNRNFIKKSNQTLEDMQQWKTLSRRKESNNNSIANNSSIASYLESETDFNITKIKKATLIKTDINNTQKTDQKCRLNIRTTEKYIQNHKAVLGKGAYASASKYGKKLWLLETVVSTEFRGTNLMIRLEHQKAISKCLVAQKLKTSSTTLSHH